MSFITISTKNKETYSSISNHFIDYYMTEASGEFVKIYLYLVRQLSSGLPFSVGAVADHFNLTEKDICRAVKYWISQDVMKLEYNEKGVLTGIVLLPLQEKKNAVSDVPSKDNIALLGLPENTKPATDYLSASKDNENKNTSSQKVSKINEIQASIIKAPEKRTYSPALMDQFADDAALSDVIFETEAYFEKPVSADDLEILIYIYDQLHFSIDLLEYLIEYCVERGKKSLRYAEKVAMSWYESKVTSRAEAKQLDSLPNPLYKAILKEMGITRGMATATEIAFMDSWSKDMNFSKEVILLACRKAMISKPASANFAYVNGILENWYKNGVKSPSDVDKLDKEFQQKKATRENAAREKVIKPNMFNTFTQTDMSDDLNELEQMFLDEVNSK